MRRTSNRQRMPPRAMREKQRLAAERAVDVAPAALSPTALRSAAERAIDLVPTAISTTALLSLTSIQLCTALAFLAHAEALASFGGGVPK